ncbi:MAG: hypothetical protein RMJ54_18895, partial [Roseiflexaceae bacterium]|nr:hypothetical protein [Roseiflexaceae bacterium]
MPTKVLLSLPEPLFLHNCGVARTNDTSPFANQQTATHYSMPHALHSSDPAGFAFFLFVFALIVQEGI